MFFVPASHIYICPGSGPHGQTILVDGIQLYHRRGGIDMIGMNSQTRNGSHRIDEKGRGVDSIHRSGFSPYQQHVLVPSVGGEALTRRCRCARLCAIVFFGGDVRQCFGWTGVLGTCKLSKTQIMNGMKLGKGSALGGWKRKGKRRRGAMTFAGRGWPRQAKKGSGNNQSQREDHDQHDT